MARKQYPTTDSTRKAISNHVPQIADEMDLDKSYLYHILAGDVSDPWGPFRRLYRGTKAAGGDTSHWRRELDAIDAKHDKRQPTESLAKCLTKILHTNADTASKMAEALEDGIVDTRETSAILIAVSKQRKALDLIETRLQLVEGGVV